jgi:hypothetical protein
MRKAFAGGMFERISRISGDKSLSTGSGILGFMVDLLTSVGVFANFLRGRIDSERGSAEASFSPACA